jgi:hypothetical protein
MPIAFSSDEDTTFVLMTYVGRLSDEEFLTAWEGYYESSQWTPGLNELNDLSQTDLREITTDGIRRLAEVANTVHASHGVSSVKVAIFAPDPLPYGLARMYGAMASESPELIRVFRGMDEARSWLTDSPDE